MRGNYESGAIQHRKEVVATGDGQFKGVLVLPGQGRRETPACDSQRAANILLEALHDKIKAEQVKASGLSSATSQAMQAALDDLGPCSNHPETCASPTCAIH